MVHHVSQDSVHWDIPTALPQSCVFENKLRPNDCHAKPPLGFDLKKMVPHNPVVSHHSCVTINTFAITQISDTPNPLSIEKIWSRTQKRICS